MQNGPGHVPPGRRIQGRDPRSSAPSSIVGHGAASAGQCARGELGQGQHGSGAARHDLHRVAIMINKHCASASVFSQEGKIARAPSLPAGRADGWRRAAAGGWWRRVAADLTRSVGPASPAAGWAQSGPGALSRKRRAVPSFLDPRGGRAGRSPVLGALRSACAAAARRRSGCAATARARRRRPALPGRRWQEAAWSAPRPAGPAAGCAPSAGDGGSR